MSPFFHDVVQVGDQIELRGPIGGHFVWSVGEGGPLLLVGGGSGLVPLASMVRHRAPACEPHFRRARSLGAHRRLSLFADELRALAAEARGLRHLATMTRDAARAGLRQGRIGPPLLRAALDGLGAPLRRAYVCGANAFVEHVATLLVDLGVPAADIRTERYGG